IVLRLTRGQILALVDTRLLLETETARLAALNPDPEEKRKLQECLEDLRVALANGDEVSQVDDKRVHIQIADMSGNPILAQLIRLITPELIVSYREFRNAHTRDTFALHEALVAAIVAGDAEKAEALMREHLLDVKKNFRDAVEKRASMRKTRSRS
ncbi:MAG: FCD domain-containing protein, partial [Planctomycetota bacterium]|nr:FCD domain-containing protein [Planctomycetota bacterium]